jgi:hypothetical protein
VPYTCFQDTWGIDASNESTIHIVSTFNVLRVSPDGSYAKIRVNQVVWDVDGAGSSNAVATGCRLLWHGSQDTYTNLFIGTDPSDPPAPLPVITNGATGVAVFSPPNACAGPTNGGTVMTTIANDTVTSQVGIPAGGFTPVLQREDGSYIGTDVSLSIPAAVNLDGSLAWQNTNVNTQMAPLYATSDGGAIFSSGALQLCHQFTEICTPLPTSATQYVFDQNGNLTAQSADLAGCGKRLASRNISRLLFLLSS